MEIKCDECGKHKNNVKATTVREPSGFGIFSTKPKSKMLCKSCRKGIEVK